jgi:hypothetical protein
VKNNVIEIDRGEGLFYSYVCKQRKESLSPHDDYTGKRAEIQDLSSDAAFGPPGGEEVSHLFRASGPERLLFPMDTISPEGVSKRDLSGSSAVTVTSLSRCFRTFFFPATAI